MALAPPQTGKCPQAFFRLNQQFYEHLYFNLSTNSSPTFYWMCTNKFPVYRPISPSYNSSPTLTMHKPISPKSLCKLYLCSNNYYLSIQNHDDFKLHVEQNRTVGWPHTPPSHTHWQVTTDCKQTQRLDTRVYWYLSPFSKWDNKNKYFCFIQKRQCSNIYQHFIYTKTHFFETQQLPISWVLPHSPQMLVLYSEIGLKFNISMLFPFPIYL